MYAARCAINRPGVRPVLGEIPENFSAYLAYLKDTTPM